MIPDREEMQEQGKALAGMLAETIKGVVTEVAEDDGIFKAQAQAAMKLYEALKDEGFTPEQADKFLLAWGPFPQVGGKVQQ